MRRPSTDNRVPEAVSFTRRQCEVQASMSGRSNVYVYGPPGSGKTTLLDAVHKAKARSARWHCAEFFRAIHDGLPKHGRDLDATVKALTGHARTVFFDEFHVHDVADAIYLHRALKWWNSHQVRVVATSNYRPEGLLPNPLLHEAAEPVIKHIRCNFEVADLDEGIDHRTNGTVCRAGFTSGKWLQPIAHEPATASLILSARALPVLPLPMGARTIETTFSALCERPWSTSDYLALLGDRKSLVLHGVPNPAAIGREPGQRLANLIDVAYDRDVPLTIHSSGSPEDLHSSAFPPLVSIRSSEGQSYRAWEPAAA